MKKGKKIVLVVVFLAAVLLAFAAGGAVQGSVQGSVQEKESAAMRNQQCQSFLSFALDKVEHQDLSERENREALISNVYAASWSCDSPALAKQLHDLWNALIFEEGCATNTEQLATELNTILDALRAG